MNKRNYQTEMEQIIKHFTDSKHVSENSSIPRLLLHSCCAPCSSYVLEYLSEYFEITVFYYNPNIWPEEEYFKRVLEQQMFIQRLPAKNPIHFSEGHFNPKEFYQAVKGLEQIPEGGARCHACFELRLRETARLAAEGHYDYFTTTLTISPLKNAQTLNEIGETLAQEYQITWLPSDFKKKNGYKRSVELSQEYNMYRQNYCGCIFSQRESQRANVKSE